MVRAMAKKPPLQPIVCIGGAHLDLVARARGPVRLAASNPVAMQSRVGGVACNVARNLARLDRPVDMLGILGRDGDAVLVEDALVSAGVNVEPMVRSDGRTGSYTVVLDEGGELVIGLANLDIYDRLTPDALSAHGALLESAGAVLADANLPAATLAWLAERLPSNSRFFAAAVSPAKAPRLKPVLPRLSALFTNRREAAVLAEAETEPPPAPAALAERLQSLGPDIAFVTAGPDGAAVAAPDVTGLVKAPPPAPLRDVNGAGDGFAAGAIDALLRGRGSEVALRQGLALASLTCESDQSASPSISPAAVADRLAMTDRKDIHDP